MRCVEYSWSKVTLFPLPNHGGPNHVLRVIFPTIATKSGGCRNHNASSITMTSASSGCGSFVSAHALGVCPAPAPWLLIQSNKLNAALSIWAPGQLPRSGNFSWLLMSIYLPSQDQLWDTWATDKRMKGWTPARSCLSYGSPEPGPHSSDPGSFSEGRECVRGVQGSQQTWEERGKKISKTGAWHVRL